MTQLVVAAEAKTDITAILDYLEEEAGAEIAAAYGENFANAVE